jgi:tRNA 2-selenouridine synthase
MASAAAVLAARDATVVDLRSPAEFAEDHVPGAINVPLFGDEERREIGTLYRRESPDVAFASGIAIARDRIEALIAAIAGAARLEAPLRRARDEFDRIAQGGLAALERRLAPEAIERLPERSVVLHCWRGGLRSRSVVALMRELGVERAVGMARGYKGFRELVRRRIEAWRAPEAFVLRGLTGVGKTLVLRAVERLRPRWTVDLEGLAQHRSSVLGRVGLAPRTQKAFESALAARIELGFDGPVVFEGESRKVGDVILPRSVWDAIQTGTSIELVAPIERRIDVLIEDYLAHPASRGELREELPFIEERLGARSQGGRLVALLDAGRHRELVELLFERYYDPLYRHSESKRTCAARFDSTDPARAAEEIVRWIEDRRSAR